MLGGVKVTNGNGLSLTSGAVSMAVGSATDAGAVKVTAGNGLAISSGAISMAAVTTSAAGAMSAADKTKLDGIASGAGANVNSDWNATSGAAQILNKPGTVNIKFYDNSATPVTYTLSVYGSIV